jgi:hypothetical protein
MHTILQESPMTIRTTLALALMAGATLAASHPALAHGRAGERVFPATMAIEDPAVTDELTLPQVQSFKEREDSGDAPRATEYSAEYSKRITPDFGLSVEGAWVDGADNDGFDNVGIGAKYQLFRNDVHEMMGAVGLDWDIGHTGNRNIGEHFSTLTPAFTFGKGFGDLPDSVEMLKPFAVTGSLGIAVPMRDGESNLLETGFTLQYSIPYMQQHVKDAGLGAPFNNMIPIVEFALETPLDHTDGHRTTGTINPGVIWMGEGMQFGAEAVLPLNHDSGSGVGVLVNMHFALDDLFPGSIGKPLLK